MNRAYSLLEIKSVDEEARILHGIASTPAPDRMDDIVEPDGAKFALPLPLLWQHNSYQPIGHVTEAKVTKDGIAIVANIAKGVSTHIDEAWALIKHGLVRGLSIGFRTLEAEAIDPKNPWGAQRFKSWEWLELSAVTIPANADASITAIKEFDTGRPAAQGQIQPAGDLTPRGAAGKPPRPPERKSKMDAKTPLAEQIASFQNERGADQARMLAILAETAGSTLDESQKEEYENLKAKMVEVDEHLVRLCEAERLSKVTAKPVTENLPAPSPARAAVTPRVEVRGNNLPKGTAFTRYAMALARCKGDLNSAANVAREWKDTPEVETVLKAAVAAGTTTDAAWAKPLVEYQAMASEFVELLRPMTIIGRIPGLRRVPFYIKVPRQTAGASAGWVGEGAPKPLSKLALDTIQLDAFKAAVIVVITEELAKFSNPSAEALIRGDLIAAIAQFLDAEFLNPAKAEAAGISPASISNGVTPTAPTGTTSDNLRVDLTTLMNTFVAANKSLGGAVWIMTPQDALKISQMQNALGQPMFPSVVGPEGGSVMGMPIVTSTNIVPGATGSRIFLVNASDILLADDGIMLDISREASVQMSDAPDNPSTATTVLVSLWQHNLVGIRAERMINWKARRTGSVQFIDNAAYVIS
jgi:HK97 family phage major capsid protein/HK97 family phage prohead protease